MKRRCTFAPTNNNLEIINEIYFFQIYLSIFQNKSHRVLHSYRKFEQIKKYTKHNNPSAAISPLWVIYWCIFIHLFLCGESHLRKETQVMELVNAIWLQEALLDALHSCSPVPSPVLVSASGRSPGIFNRKNILNVISRTLSFQTPCNQVRVTCLPLE